jgi:predicted transcriptional regulator
MAVKKSRTYIAKSTGVEMVRFTLWVPTEIGHSLARLAAINKRSQSWIIREVLGYVTQRPEMVEAVGLKNK